VDRHAGHCLGQGPHHRPSASRRRARRTCSPPRCS
jgi:hypothetical protein